MSNLNKSEVKEVALACFLAGKNDMPDKSFDALFQENYSETLHKRKKWRKQK